MNSGVSGKIYRSGSRTLGRGCQIDSIPANRSLEYRKRAEEARAKADETTDETNKRSWLHTADTWERMASWEDITNPPKPIPGSK